LVFFFFYFIFFIFYHSHCHAVDLTRFHISLHQASSALATHVMVGVGGKGIIAGQDEVQWQE
jgi:hypothetical protein